MKRSIYSIKKKELGHTDYLKTDIKRERTMDVQSSKTEE